MRDQIRRLGADTAIYGVSTILGRFLNFLLVPFYTHVLAPGAYGVVAYVYTLIAFVNVVYGYGMESAYFKYASTREIGSARENFTTPFLSLLTTSLVLSVLLTLFASPVARLSAIPVQYGTLVTYAAWILFLDTIAVIPFAALRLERRAMYFGIVKLLNIVINVAANLLFLLVVHTGIEGIFLSGLIASAVTVVLLLPVILQGHGWVFRGDLYRALLRFALPYLPSGLAAMMIQVADRFVLWQLADEATVGIYQANYRLGIFMMLVVSMFDYAWRPFFLTNANAPNARELFARVLTYFVLVATAVTLALSLWINDLVALQIFGRRLIHPAYWSGLGIVPVVLLGYLFLGVYTNFMAGVYIEKRTGLLPGITITGAVVNVVGTIVLFPRWGMMGAAVSTLLAYAVMAGVMYAVVRRIYPVPYEWGRIGLVALAGVVVYGVYVLIPAPIWPVLWKVLLLGGFFVLLAGLRFFRPGEGAALRALLRGRGAS